MSHALVHLSATVSHRLRITISPVPFSTDRSGSRARMQLRGKLIALKQLLAASAAG